MGTISSAQNRWRARKEVFSCQLLGNVACGVFSAAKKLIRDRDDGRADFLQF